MSINYYGVPVRDAKRIGAIVEGDDTSSPIDEAKIRKALRSHVKGKDRGTLKWESDGDYVFVDVLPAHVLVTHNAGRGSYQLEVVMGVLEVLQSEGLFVYDPQQGNWFPG
jgi:hypothetical protein